MASLVKLSIVYFECRATCYCVACIQGEHGLQLIPPLKGGQNWGRTRPVARGCIAARKWLINTQPAATLAATQGLYGLYYGRSNL